MRSAFLLVVACASSPPPAGVDSGEDAAGPRPASLRLNEVQTRGDAGDWVELFNGADHAVDLAGWTLSDGGAATRLSARSLQPGELGVIGDEELGFGLDADGETLVLADPDGVEVDRMQVPALQEGHSYGLDEPFDEVILVADGSPARFLGDPPGDVSPAGFDDSEWSAVRVPVGFDHSVEGGEVLERALGIAARCSTRSPKGRPRCPRAR